MTRSVPVFCPDCAAIVNIPLCVFGAMGEFEVITLQAVLLEAHRSVVHTKESHHAK